MSQQPRIIARCWEATECLSSMESLELNTKKCKNHFCGGKKVFLGDLPYLRGNMGGASQILYGGSYSSLHNLCILADEKAKYKDRKSALLTPPLMLTGA